jgi:hypothetical protein
MEHEQLPEQDDLNIREGIRMRLSPRIAAEDYEGIDMANLLEHKRLFGARVLIANDRLAELQHNLEIWREQARLGEQQKEIQEHNVRIINQRIAARKDAAGERDGQPEERR